MVVLTIVFAVLLLILTGMLWPAIIASGWMIVAAISAMLLATWLRSFFRDAIALFSLAIPQPVQSVSTDVDSNAPRPGDPDWLDWANWEGKYARPPRA